MSRTDKTKPWRVRRAEHAPRPDHDHRFTPCDLPADPIDPDSGTACHWAFTELWRGCCSGQTSRAGRKEWSEMQRTANRKDRHSARLWLHRFMTDGLDD